MKKTLVSLALVVVLSGCFTTGSQPPTQAQQEAAKVRFLPESQVGNCQFVTQANLTQDGSFFGGETTEAYAQAKLRHRAVSAGANTVVITDRLFDKGRGGYDKTRISYFANLYRC